MKEDQDSAQRLGQDQCGSRDGINHGATAALAGRFDHHREQIAAIHYPLYWLTKRCTAELEAKKVAQNGWMDPLDAGRLGSNRRSRDEALAVADRIVAYLNTTPA